VRRREDTAAPDIAGADTPRTEKDKLLAIPTGLMIVREDVDLLIQQGENAITGSTELRKFCRTIRRWWRPLPDRLQGESLRTTERPIAGDSPEAARST
jgi:hypothetical protein